MGLQLSINTVVHPLTCLVICEEEVDHAKQLQNPLLRATPVHLVVIQDKVRVDLEREQHYTTSYQAT